MKVALVVVASLMVGGAVGYAIAYSVERFLQAPWYR